MWVGLLHLTFRDLGTRLRSPNVVDQEYLHFKLISIGHKQNALSFSHPDRWAFSATAATVNRPGMLKAGPQSGCTLSSLTPLLQGQQQLGTLSPSLRLGLPFNSFPGPLCPCPHEAPKHILNSAKSQLKRSHSLQAPV